MQAFPRREHAPAYRLNNQRQTAVRPETAVVGGGCVPNCLLDGLHVFPPSFPVGAFACWRTLRGLKVRAGEVRDRQ
jgi:hypothetical protein